MEKDICNQVCSFIQSAAGLGDAVLPVQTLFGDLSIDGEDARELLAAFADRFQVDMSGFCLESYFGPERAATPLSLIVVAKRLLGAGAEEAASLKPLHVADLISAAERKRW